MKTILTALQGKKTYIVAGGMIAYQVLGHYLYGTAYDPLAIFNALGLAALRAGVAKAAS